MISVNSVLVLLASITLNLVLCRRNRPPGLLFAERRTNSTSFCIFGDTFLPDACGGDINAVPDCGNRCAKTCFDYQADFKICPTLPCNPNGCGCREGYVFDEIAGKCVLPENCSNQCPRPHERLSNCIEGECGAMICETIGLYLPCSLPLSCNPGCLCEMGYVRDASGNCIKESECPNKCPHPNEIFEGCIRDDCVWHCGDIENAVACRRYEQCTPGCICMEGYLRDESGKCIKRRDCQSYLVNTTVRAPGRVPIPEAAQVPKPMMPAAAAAAAATSQNQSRAPSYK